MDNDNTPSTSSTASSITGSTHTSGNYINHTDSTCSVSPTTSSSSESKIDKPSQPQANQTPTANNNANFIEQLVQQHQFNNKATLARQQMFDSLLQQANRNNHESPVTQTKFRYTGINQHPSFNNTGQHLTGSDPQAPLMPPPTNNTNTLNATAAYLVQTPNGNALLIPPQTALNPTNQFIQTTNTISLNRHNSSASNPYGIQTVPFQQAATLLNENHNFNVLNGFPHSPSNCFSINARPESTGSTNVYQTIDATEKNGYLYPVESGYDSSSFYNNLATINNKNFSNTVGRNKHRTNYQQHIQNQIVQQSQLHQFHQHQLHQQQQSQFSKLLDSNNTNSNLFSSPSMSTESTTNNNKNRRLIEDSKLNRMRHQITRKLQGYCSWKFMALLFLFIILNLFTFTVYLTVMRTYNLNWHLQSSSSIQANGKLLKASVSPVPYSIGSAIQDSVMPQEVYNIQVHVYSGMHVKFNISIAKDSNIGVYMEKNTLPTLTKFTYFETFNGKELIKQTNNSPRNLVNTAFVHYLDEGVWFISILNDNDRLLSFHFQTEFYESDTSLCPQNCNGKGDCGPDGQCQCFTGFSGPDCSEKSCPVMCSGNGFFENGKCSCNFGYHGADCRLPLDKCEVPNCSNNGDCVQGKCSCHQGFTGEFCDQVACLSVNCSNNGVCQQGTCQCFAGYSGPDCAQIVPSLSSLCSQHGEFNYETRTCLCSDGWLGTDCSTNVNCLDHRCTTCSNGWSGVDCLEKVPLKCDARCQEHGICVNGTCNCSPGYQGRNCDVNSCPNSCSSNGVCEKSVDQYTKYECVCNQGWSGKACDVAVEMMCNDDIDNDGDGLTDCMDSECCGFDSCKLTVACQSSPEPKDRLLRKQPPSLSATFYEKMRFLIEDNSVQSFANSNSFRDSQVSVIRGQVLFKNGQPLIGVKVSSVSNPVFGYTLTRHNGIFDLMVNGGGSVLLEFSRKDLKSKQISTTAIWNQFVHIDTVHMFLIADKSPDSDLAASKCHASTHNSTNVQPVVKTSWREIRTYFYDNSVILPESGVVRNEVNLMDTDLKLVYTSNQASGFSSTIFILLTKRSIPETLQRIHLKITVEGVLHKQVLDAYPLQSYEYSWDRRNAYEQRVYGVTYAKVMVGYEYENCEFIYWESRGVKLAGYDLGSSEIGNWNIDVHHRLNPQQGILHKGDGTTVYLNEVQTQVEIVAGQLKKKRDVDCSIGEQCDRYSSEPIKFYSPSSISINKDGLVFIADHNYVWMLNNSGVPERILELEMDQPYKYYLGNDQSTGNLFVVDSINKKLLKVKNIHQKYGNLKQNAQSTDTFCFDHINRFSPECRQPKSLQSPKSFAFDQNDIMFFIDGNRVRSIDPDGIVRTLIGKDNDQQTVYKPMGCNLTYPLHETNLYWPSVLRINPIDNSVYILDENVIYKITSFDTVEVIAGTPYGCLLENFSQLTSPIDMAFNSEGDLFILENDGLSNKKVRLFKTTGELSTFYDGENIVGLFGQHLTFSDPIAIAVHQNRSVYVLDREDNVLYHIRSSIEKDEYASTYTLVSPETQESYVFNRFGLHLSTINLLTGSAKFNFSYSGNALYGKLVSVADQNKIVVNIKRDFHGRAELMQLGSDLSARVKLNNFNMLKSVEANDGRSYMFKYLGNTGLLTSSTDPKGNVVLFNYHENGKVKEITEPNNMITKVGYHINSSGIVTSVNRANLYTETWISNSTSTSIYKNGQLETILEASKYNFNIRALTSEADYNSFHLYYKSILNFQPQLIPNRRLKKNEPVRSKNPKY